jgi:hypothetical protein
MALAAQEGPEGTASVISSPGNNCGFRMVISSYSIGGSTLWSHDGDVVAGLCKAAGTCGSILDVVMLEVSLSITRQWRVNFKKKQRKLGLCAFLVLLLFQAESTRLQQNATCIFIVEVMISCAAKVKGRVWCSYRRHLVRY